MLYNDLNLIASFDLNPAYRTSKEPLDVRNKQVLNYDLLTVINFVKKAVYLPCEFYVNERQTVTVVCLGV